MGFEAIHDDYDKSYVEVKSVGFDGNIRKTTKLLTGHEIDFLMNCHKGNSKLFPVVKCKAYDLETILEALPVSVDKGDYTLNLDNDYVAYSFIYGDQLCVSDNLYITEKTDIEAEENESLANTAGRLLVKLLEDNIIKLGEVTNDEIF